MKRSALIAAIALAGAACSGSSGGPISDPKPVDPGVATVTFSVAFPARTGAVKTLLDPLADTVTIEWLTLAGSPVGSVDVTRADPSATATIPVGSYYFLATAFDALGETLETAGTGGTLIAGENSVVMTFLDGKWTFATPVELSNGMVLNGFYLTYRINELDARSSVNHNALSLLSVQDLTWIVNEGTLAEEYLATQSKTEMQFGGGFANRNYLDGGGWNVDSGCGENYYGNGDPACGNGGPGAGVNFRVIGDLTASGGDNQATSALLPKGTFTPPAVESFGDTAFVDGTHLTGHVLEYAPSGTQPTPVVVTGLTSAASAPVAKSVQSTPDSTGTVTITEFRSAIVCKDGYNGTVTDGSIQYGTWDFHDWDWQATPPTITRNCAVDFDSDGIMDYAECGTPNPPGSPGPADLGECNWGLVNANPADQAEICECWDNNTQTCNTPCTGNGVLEPWDFQDINHDGVVDLGSYYFEHYVQSGFTLDYSSYPFTATGTATAPTTMLTIQ